MKLLEPEEDYSLAIYSSGTFIDLFIELWLVGERSAESDGPQLNRLVDTSLEQGCSIITLADAILSNNASREVFLSRCTNQGLCRQFTLALTDRAARESQREFVYLANWVGSLTKLVSVTSRLYESSTVLCECLTTFGYLPELASQVAALVETIYADPEIHVLHVLIGPILFQLAKLYVKKDLPFAGRKIWSQLHDGYYIETLFRATALASEDKLQSLLLILEHMGDYAAYPWVLGGRKRDLERVSLDKLEHIPKAADQWAMFLGAYTRSVDAVKTLGSRPDVYFCDYLPVCAPISTSRVLRS